MAAVSKNSFGKLDKKGLIRSFRIISTLDHIFQDPGHKDQLPFSNEMLFHIIVGLKLSSSDFIITPQPDVALLIALGYSPYEILEQFINKADLNIPSVVRLEKLAHNAKPMVYTPLKGGGFRALSLVEANEKEVDIVTLNKKVQHNKGLLFRFLTFDTNLTMQKFKAVIDLKGSLNPSTVILLFANRPKEFLYHGDKKKSRWTMYCEKQGVEVLSVDNQDFINLLHVITNTIQGAKNRVKRIVIVVKQSKLASLSQQSKIAYLSEIKEIVKQRLLVAGATISSLKEIEMAINTYVKKEQNKFYLENDGNQKSKNADVEDQVDLQPHGKNIFEEVVEKIIRQNKKTQLICYTKPKSLKLIEKKFWKKQQGKRWLVLDHKDQDNFFGTIVAKSAFGLKPIVYFEHLSDFITTCIAQLTVLKALTFDTHDGVGGAALLWIRVLPKERYLIEKCLDILLGISGINVLYPSSLKFVAGLVQHYVHLPELSLIIEDKMLLQDTLDPIVNEGFDSLKLAKFPFDIQRASEENIKDGNAILVITYGEGVPMVKNVCKSFENQVTILDLCTLYPIDWEKVHKEVKMHNKLLLLTITFGKSLFSEALVGKIYNICFEYLDAPITYINEKTMVLKDKREPLQKGHRPIADNIRKGLNELLAY